MPKRVSKKEESLYQPIMKTLKRVFSCLGECHLEITADKRFTNKLKRHFSKDTLYIIRVEGFFPDLTGFVKTQYTTDIITVEAKAKHITIKDIFQAKNQAEIFDAKYALLVSPKMISEEIRRFVKDRSLILNYLSSRRLVIAQFNEATEEFEIDKELYYGSLPEPFKSHRNALEAENLKITDVDFGEKPESTMRVHVTNMGDVTVKIVETRLNDLSFTRNVVLEPRERAWIKFSKEWSKWVMFSTRERIARWRKNKIELITENGKKISIETEAPEHAYYAKKERRRLTEFS